MVDLPELSADHRSAANLHIMVVVAFKFRTTRLRHLLEVATGFAEYTDAAVDFIVTTTADDAELATLERSLVPLRTSGMRVSFRQVPFDAAVPYRVTWAHKSLLREVFLADSRYSHFIYVEDDIRLSQRNFSYFRRFREKLRPYGLLPGFLRYEFNDTDYHTYLVDHREPTRVADSPGIDLGDVRFVNVDPPYQACFVLDRELAAEHAAGPSFDVEASKIYGHGEAERANLAFSFENIPASGGFTSRYVMPLDRNTGLPLHAALIRHLPDNFTNRVPPILKFGTLPIEAMFRSDNVSETVHRHPANTGE
ncbi:hypothetical protein AruPA_08090 [Acidiphilium sp. PA]|uniref:hypothetical protein n=1 Tax=Acidiphilium sp. PA TaxID=2871705 RepID=UPI0022446494|nr:hypothetical protein [Acidiphilium sp. PA]MCW8306994.1 hypothetical protein [Acidiphilium sp. PA]